MRLLFHAQLPKEGGEFFGFVFFRLYPSRNPRTSLPPVLDIGCASVPLTTLEYAEHPYSTRSA